jgi:hypothetical protein
MRRLVVLLSLLTSLLLGCSYLEDKMAERHPSKHNYNPTDGLVPDEFNSHEDRGNCPQAGIRGRDYKSRTPSSRDASLRQRVDCPRNVAVLVQFQRSRRSSYSRDQ